MTLTKRNHYNPCFWTAYWNHAYYQLALSGTAKLPDARKQQVHVLSVRSGTIFPTAVENIHFDKNLGIAEITREAAEDFARRNHPTQYADFLKNNATAEYPVYLDFEDILTGIENTEAYRALINVIRRGHVGTTIEKGFLGCFIFIQLQRSHAIMNSMIEWQSELQRHKFEHFIKLKWLLSDRDAIYSLLQPIGACRWTIYRADSDAFPLCDSPILIRPYPHDIMVALSPRLLLEIQPPIREDENALPRYKKITPTKLAEFRRRTIGNTFREIISGDRALLEYWQNSSEFKERVETMKDVTSYNRLVQIEGAKELWHINSYGNR